MRENSSTGSACAGEGEGERKMKGGRAAHEVRKSAGEGRTKTPVEVKLFEQEPTKAAPSNPRVHLPSIYRIP